MRFWVPSPSWDFSYQGLSHIAKFNFPSLSAVFGHFLIPATFFIWLPGLSLFSSYLAAPSQQSPLLILPQLPDLCTPGAPGLRPGALFYLTHCLAALIQPHSSERHSCADNSQIPSWTPNSWLIYPTVCQHLHLDVSNSVNTKENSFQLLLPQSSRSNTLESSLTALSHTPRISSINKSYWFHLRNIPRIWVCLTTAIMNTRAQATVISLRFQKSSIGLHASAPVAPQSILTSQSDPVKTQVRSGQVTSLLCSKSPSSSFKCLSPCNFPTRSG